MKTTSTILLFLILISSCKPCVKCKYNTLKGDIQKKYCSSTKSDREKFKTEMEAEAKANGTVAVCKAVGY